MKCPKCGYERQPTDDAPEWRCPSCQIAYIKAMPPEPVEVVEVDDAGQETDERLLLAAQGQKIVIYCIILNFLLRAVERSLAKAGLAHVDLWMMLLFIGAAVWALFGILKICSGLGKSQNQKICYMVMSFVPLINLITLVYLSVKATKLLRKAGVSVGLLGARI